MRFPTLTLHLNLALSYLSRNRVRAAEREARAALLLQPNAFTAYTALAEALRAQRRCSEAHAVIDEGLARLAQPDPVTAEEYEEQLRTALQLRLIRAACWAAVGDHRSAISELRTLRQCDAKTDDDWLVTFYLASILYDQRLFEQAEILCHETLLDAPPMNAPQVYSLLASVVEARGDTTPALEYCRLALAGPALVTRGVAITTFRRLLRLAGLRLTLSFCWHNRSQVFRHLYAAVFGSYQRK